MGQVYRKEEQKKFEKTSTKTEKKRGEGTGSNRFMLVTIDFMMHYAEINPLAPELFFFNFSTSCI